MGAAGPRIVTEILRAVGFNPMTGAVKDLGIGAPPSYPRQ
jgi:hypothetical protein